VWDEPVRRAVLTRLEHALTERISPLD
jgi:hypothetical protein